MEKDQMHSDHEHIEQEKQDIPDAVGIENGPFRRVSRSVVRKLDMTLLPMVWVLYLFNYIDRNNIRCLMSPSFFDSKADSNRAQSSQTCWPRG
jgi:hypothetical protein